ncbi:MAG TPA: methyltransferase [Pyrinomonadaceae bacterium]|jgi:ubiquinone/menaquinone biosynthesis C-methylase UbiE|nr:methyltransferase [Pyrinomonadaceae bacterium]
MKLRLEPEGIRERIVFTAGLFPRLPMLSLMGTQLSQVIIAGCSLNVFNQMLDGPQTANAIADRTSCSQQGMEVLLDSLNGFGILHRRQGLYSLTRETRKWLTRESSYASSLESIGLNREIGKRFTQLEECVKTGHVDNIHLSDTNSAWWPSYLNALKSAGRLSAPRLIKWLKLHNISPKRFLDVGGGPGLTSIALCKEFPSLAATIIELPSLVKEGTAGIVEANLQDRIRYIEGSALESDFGTGYDLALMSNFLHVITGVQCREVIQKTYDALAPGGILVIQDTYHPGEDGDVPLQTGLASLMYYVTAGSRAWPIKTVEKWLREAGFEKTQAEKPKMGIFVAGHKSLGTPAATQK